MMDRPAINVPSPGHLLCLSIYKFIRNCCAVSGERCKALRVPRAGNKFLFIFHSLASAVLTHVVRPMKEIMNIKELIVCAAVWTISIVPRAVTHTFPGEHPPFSVSLWRMCALALTRKCRNWTPIIFFWYLLSFKFGVQFLALCAFLTRSDSAY